MSEDNRHPWEQYGLVFSAVWLIFLGFPVVSVLTGDHGPGGVAVGLTAIVAFGAVYVAGFARFELDGAVGGTHRAAPAYLAAMVLLIGVVWAVIGAESLGMAAFVVSFAMFTLPLAAALVTSGAVLVVSVVAPIVSREPGELALVLIVLLVGLVTGALRVMLQRGAEHEALAAEMALVAERERVARDVHDVLGHSLTVVTAKAELAARLVDADPARAVEEMRQVAALSREALGEVRHTVGGLRVARLGDEVTSARSALDAAGIGADVHGEVVDVDPRHRPVLAWVLRELVTNVVRHSGASRCEVRLATSGVTVLDDGRGCPAGAEGNGLRGVRERLAATGGVLVLTRTDPGTRAEVRL
ncbi:two-component sensor histidine kinase [Marmoricola endophyticus]|uniref:Two-component sensor histidine kinase n=1 Tax=Marmoricola endophyticus TaxID=2040280 RepID=A0A917F7C0_9ACTN|nr:sensor histidine kinase [Marmoricola endophyticus]GGF55275.1 two-component sensor histidine kinase [Marmoricola endophyticus]